LEGDTEMTEALLYKDLINQPDILKDIQKCKMHLIRFLIFF